MGRLQPIRRRAQAEACGYEPAAARLRLRTCGYEPAATNAGQGWAERPPAECIVGVVVVVAGFSPRGGDARVAVSPAKARRPKPAATNAGHAVGRVGNCRCSAPGRAPAKACGYGSGSGRGHTPDHGRGTLRTMTRMPLRWPSPVEQRREIFGSDLDFAEDLSKERPSEIAALVKGNGCGAAVRMAIEDMPALLADLLEPEAQQDSFQVSARTALRRFKRRPRPAGCRRNAGGRPRRPGTPRGIARPLPAGSP